MKTRQGTMKTRQCDENKGVVIERNGGMIKQNEYKWNEGTTYVFVET